MRLILFTYFFYCFSLLTSAQTSKRQDSLLTDLQKPGNDTLKVKKLLRLSESVRLYDAQASLKYSMQAMALAETLKWNKGIAMAYFRSAYAYDNLGNFSKALQYRLKELKKWKDLGNENNVCISLCNIGVSYSDLGNNLKAVEYYEQSLRLAEKIKYTEQIIQNLCNIGSVYKEQGDHKKAFEYYLKSLKIAEEHGDQRNIAINRGNLGNLYTEINNYSKALESYLIALHIDEKSGDKRNFSAWLANIGNLYQLQADSAYLKGNIPVSKIKSDKALEYFQEGLKYARELGNKYLEAYALGNIGHIFIGRKKHAEAEAYLNRSLAVAEEINAIDVMADTHQRLYMLYKNDDKTAKALSHLEKHIAIKDSLQKESNKKAVAELQVRFDTEKKENENRSLSQKNEMQELTIKKNLYFTWFMALLLILMAAIGFLVVRQYKLRSKQLASNLEQKLLRTQMNPHFIFNSLASIESFIYDHEPKEAGIYLSRFSKLMRLILEHSTLEFIPLEKEVEILTYYLSLQKLRLDDKLEYSIHIDEKVNPTEVYLPPMLAQPFIENAIEHGFRGTDKKGEISIHFTVVNDYLRVEIIDNGIGIEKAQQQKDEHKTHKSLAMQITAERLYYLNRLKGKKLSYQVSDIPGRETGVTGTRIIFEVPLERHS